jgi:hypothetical protein
MSKKCGGCSKTVYPAEELKCLDQSWHKSCFKCSDCGMTLNLKNYVGFDKRPYCNAHNPSKRLQATVVAETPEGRRIQEITKLNSGVEYRKDYEQSKGQMISIADDPSMTHARQISVNASGYRSNQYGDEEYDEEQQQGPVATPFANPAAAPPPPSSAGRSSKALYQAIYDYEAQDGEEVSFSEGDIIENYTVIDEGWGQGTVQSTGQTGMIPSNYVQEM